jgi:hypothetical protein
LVDVAGNCPCHNSLTLGSALLYLRLDSGYYVFSFGAIGRNDHRNLGSKWKRQVLD